MIDKVFNPDTNRWVLADGRVGKAVIAKLGKAVTKRKESDKKPTKAPKSKVVEAAPKKKATKAPKSKVVAAAPKKKPTPKTGVNAEILNMVALQASPATLGNLAAVNKMARYATKHPDITKKLELHQKALDRLTSALKYGAHTNILDFRQTITVVLTDKKHKRLFKFKVLTDSDGMSLYGASLFYTTENGKKTSYNVMPDEHYDPDLKSMFKEVAKHLLSVIDRAAMMQIDLLRGSNHVIHKLDLTASTFVLDKSNTQLLDQHNDNTWHQISWWQSRNPELIIRHVREFSSKLFDILHHYKKHV